MTRFSTEMTKQKAEAVCDSGTEQESYESVWFSESKTSSATTIV